MLLEKVKQTIKKRSLLKKGDKVIVGISGGPDSVCLLNILYRLSKEYSLKLFAAHVNYSLRGKDSDGDEQFVRDFTGKLEIPISVKRLSAKSWELSTENLEEKAREVRYEFFSKLLQDQKANSIAVGHTADDQVETILMRFLRGSGIKGLGGMAYKRDEIIRPLLDCTEEEVRNYLKENKLKYRIDITNTKPKFFRNKIRLGLLPLLEKKYNPNIKETILRNAEVFRDDYEFLRGLASHQSSVISHQSSKNEIKVDLEKWLKLPKSLKRETLRLSLENLSGNLRDISAKHIEEVMDMLEKSETGKRKELPQGLQVHKKRGKIVIVLPLR